MFAESMLLQTSVYCKKCSKHLHRYVWKLEKRVRAKTVVKNHCIHQFLPLPMINFRYFIPVWFNSNHLLLLVIAMQ